MTAVTFLTLFPLTQVIVVFLATAALVGVGAAIVGVGDGEAAPLSAMSLIGRQGCYCHQECKEKDLKAFHIGEITSSCK